MLIKQLKPLWLIDLFGPKHLSVFKSFASKAWRISTGRRAKEALSSLAVWFELQVIMYITLGFSCTNMLLSYLPSLPVLLGETSTSKAELLSC